MSRVWKCEKGRTRAASGRTSQQTNTTRYDTSHAAACTLESHHVDASSSRVGLLLVFHSSLVDRHFDSMADRIGFEWPLVLLLHDVACYCCCVLLLTNICMDMSVVVCSLVDLCVRSDECSKCDESISIDCCSC